MLAPLARTIPTITILYLLTTKQRRAPQEIFARSAHKDNTSYNHFKSVDNQAVAATLGDFCSLRSQGQSKPYNEAILGFIRYYSLLSFQPIQLSLSCMLTITIGTTICTRKCFPNHPPGDATIGTKNCFPNHPPGGATIGTKNCFPIHPPGGATIGTKNCFPNHQSTY